MVSRRFGRSPGRRPSNHERGALICLVRESSFSESHRKAGFSVEPIPATRATRHGSLLPSWRATNLSVAAQTTRLAWGLRIANTKQDELDDGCMSKPWSRRRHCAALHAQRGRRPDSCRHSTQGRRNVGCKPRYASVLLLGIAASHYRATIRRAPVSAP